MRKMEIKAAINGQTSDGRDQHLRIELKGSSELRLWVTVHDGGRDPDTMSVSISFDDLKCYVDTVEAYRTSNPTPSD